MTGPVAPPLGAGLAGRAVLVVGGAGAIGQATCEQLAVHDVRVVVADRVAPGSWFAALPGAGHAAVEIDLGAPGAPATLVARVWDELGPVQGLVYLAAVLRRQRVEEVTETDWEAQHAVGLRAAFFTTREVAQRWVAGGVPGSVVLATSQGWWTGGIGTSLAYNAAKGGVTTLVRGLARSYGAAGIRVNAVAPGAVASPMLEQRLSDAARAGILAATPLGRLGRPDEIARTIVFLLGEHASFVSAAVLNVSGGWLPY